MPSLPRIVSFRNTVEAQRSEPDAEKLVSGTPRLAAWNHYADPTNQFFAGVWEGTRGAWRVRYSEHEFCHLLSGRVALVSEAGERQEFAAGDSFVIPSGFAGTWEVLENCRKLYAIFEPAG